jgi:hypothetical protein
VAGQAHSLDELTALLGHALLAELPRAVESLVAAIQRRASTGSDVPQLMSALPSLARAMRYGNVRQTDATLVATVVAGIVGRICVGLPLTCTSLNDEAAAELFDRIEAVQRALTLIDDPQLYDDWMAALAVVMHQEGAHLLLRGRALRLLHEARRVKPGELAREMGLAISPGVPRTDAALWIEGFLKGSGLVLIHDDSLWTRLSGWVAGLTGEGFTEVLPLLRRTFATFPAAERRQMGERVKRGGMVVAASETGPAAPFHYDRAAKVLPILNKILGNQP